MSDNNNPKLDINAEPFIYKGISQDHINTPPYYPSQMPYMQNPSFMGPYSTYNQNMMFTPFYRQQMQSFPSYTPNNLTTFNPPVNNNKPYTQPQTAPKEEPEAPTQQKKPLATTKLNPNCRCWIPKTRVKEQNSTNDTKEKKEIKEIKEIIKNKYFIVLEGAEGKKFKFTYDYMLGFENWKMSKEMDLLTPEVREHIKNFEVNVVDNIKIGGNKEYGGKKDRYGKGKDKYSKKGKDYSSYSQNQNQGQTTQEEEPKSPANNSLEKWGRKDLSHEISLAEQFKQKFEEHRKEDPVKFDLTELLNVLTHDNYAETKEKIIEKIQNNKENQDKFLDVLFNKAVQEKAFVKIYASLCKELDKILEPKTQPQEEGKKCTSYMRSKLLERCRDIFKTDDNTKLENYINYKRTDSEIALLKPKNSDSSIGDKKLDQEDSEKQKEELERETKIKKFVLGNVNFIGELIDAVVLSKKIVYNCIDNLFKRFNKENNDKNLHLVNLEAIVVLMDKFGTQFYKKIEKKKKPDVEEFERKMDIYIKELDEYQKEKELPGHLKYKIINLVAKKNEGWQESGYQKSIAAKSKAQVRKEFEEANKIHSEGERLSGDEVNARIRTDLVSYREHIDDGGTQFDYDWKIMSDIYEKNHSVADILSGFIDSCFDLAQKNKDLDYFYTYSREFLFYYRKIMRPIERGELIDKINELLKSAYEFDLDNKLMVNIFGAVLYNMITLGIYPINEIDSLKDLPDYNLETIFKILSFACEYEIDDVQISYRDFKNTEIAKANEQLFNSIFGK